jgi:hypothetical protein
MVSDGSVSCARIASRHVRPDERKEDVYYDYLAIVTGSTFDPTRIKWRLASSVTPTEFQIWETDMDGGFERCKAFDSTFGDQNEFAIA